MTTSTLTSSLHDMDCFTPAFVSADFDPSQLASDLARKRAACEECRKRKLKCSGQASGCARCIRNGLSCIYSEQKQMGRPKKRRNVDRDHSAESSISWTANDIGMSATDQEQPDLHNIEPIDRTAPLPSLRSASPSSTTSPRPENARTPTETEWYNMQYPPAVSLWPYFSRTELPTPVASTVEKETTALRDVLSSTHGVPDSGFSLNHWKRISKSPATEIRMGFCPSSTSSCVQAEMTVRQDLEWRTFIYYLMRYYVFGDHELPALPDQQPETAQSYLSAASTEPHITLVFLADAMERRQRVWHDMEPDTGEFPQAGARESILLYSGYTLEELKEMDKCHSQGNGLVCIDLINYAKRCIRTLDTEVPRIA
ncbi:hypothetical protein DV735_g4394, partial [Chaetothyriales sp. CBS 134920]